MPLSDTPRSHRPGERPTGDDGDLADQLSAMARSLQAAPDLHETLRGIVHAAVVNVPGADHAGITTVRRRVVSTPAATDELVEQIDRVQYELGRGPCLDSIRHETTVRADDLSTDQRWGEFGARTVELGVRSMLSFQLYVGDEGLGALNLYAEEVDGFGPQDEHDGLLLASHAAIAMVGAQQEDHLRAALTNRDIIGQAKGVLMERHKVTADQAFNLLMRASQDRNRKLVDLARLVAETGQDPRGN